MRNFFVFLIFFTCSSVLAEEFSKFRYTPSETEKLENILELFVKSGTKIDEKSPTVIKTISMNPGVKNWKRLKAGESLQLYFSKKDFDLERYKAYRKELKKKELEKEVEEKILDTRPQGTKLSLFTMTSSGSFTQEGSATNNVSIDFSQNSPVTLGLSALYFPKRKHYYFTGSFYYSDITEGARASASAVSIPAEYGFTGHINWDSYRYGFSYYTGLDYETFSTFNTGALANSALVRLDTSKVLFYTAGVSKFFKIWKLPLFAKLSFSQSLNTSTEISTGGVPVTDKYSGYKVLFYLNYKFHKRWFLHTLNKYHKMSGPDDLTITRIGLGLGFILL